MALVYQKLTLEVTPGMIPPVLHVTEYDINMQIDVTFTQRGQPFEIPSGTTAKVEGTLAGHPFRKNCTVNGNTVAFTLSENMTAYAGRAWTKIVLTKDGWPVSTCGFWLDCDRAGVEADTIIGASGFEEQIKQAVGDYLDESGFVVDDTLSQQGSAADAKATGDALALVRDNIASEYDSSMYYQTGAYVIHSGKLYRARAEIAPEAWNEAHWIRDSLAERLWELENAQIETDDTLTIEGAAADAAAVGELRDSVMPAAKTVSALDITIHQEATKSETVNLNLGVGGNASDFIAGEYYSFTDGTVKTTGNANGSRREKYYAVKPESTLHLDTLIIATFYDEAKAFISGIKTNRESDVTVPANAYYARFSSDRWNATTDNYSLNYRFGAIKTNALVTESWLETENLVIPYGRVSETESVNNAVTKAGQIEKAFDMFQFVVPDGELTPVVFGKTYASNPFVNGGGTSGDGVLRFYDADKNPITFPELASNWAGGFLAGQNGNWRIKDGTYFSLDGAYITSYHLHANPRQATHELPVAPTYIKLSGGKWTVGNGTYSSDVSDDLQWVLYDEEKNRGLFEQIQTYVASNILSSVDDSELGRWMKHNAIRQSNKMRHAWRVATFNIYGAGYNQRNWTAVKELLQNYGIDMIGFQEVNQPLSTNSAGQTFQQALTSWQFTQFGIIQTEDVPGSCRPVAATSEFEVVSIEETKYATQSNYGHRHFTKTQLKLPRWKDKKASENFMVSIYNTQLEVGTSVANNNTRLAQAAELIAAMNADTNPFIILVGDFNEMSVGRDTVNLIKNAGYSPQFDDTSTPTAGRGFYDFIFVNERISVVGNDVVPCDLHTFENGTLNISDHDLVFADVVFNYENLISVKTSLPNCTLSGGGYWLDRRQTEPVVYTVTPDEGYTVQSISTGQGDNDLTYDNGAVVLSGNTVTIKPNLVVGDVWINVTTASAS